MKIRLGFVANSSSSSFVLLDASTKKRPIMASVSFDISELVDIVITDLSILDKYLKDEYWEKKPSWYNKAVNILKAGGAVRIGSYANDGDHPMERMLYDTGFGDVSVAEGVEVVES